MVAGGDVHLICSRGKDCAVVPFVFVAAFSQTETGIHRLHLLQPKNEACYHFHISPKSLGWLRLMADFVNTYYQMGTDGV